MGPESPEIKDNISGVIKVSCPYCRTDKNILVERMVVGTISAINVATCENKKCRSQFYFYVIAGTKSATKRRFKNPVSAYLSHEAEKRKLQS